MGDFYMELKWDFQSWGEHCFAVYIISLCEPMFLGMDIVQMYLQIGMYTTFLKESEYLNTSRQSIARICSMDTCMHTSKICM